MGVTEETLVEPLNFQTSRSGENILTIYLGDLAGLAATEETPTTTSIIMEEIVAKEEMRGNIGVSITIQTTRKAIVVMGGMAGMAARGEIVGMYNQGIQVDSDLAVILTAISVLHCIEYIELGLSSLPLGYFAYGPPVNKRRTESRAFMASRTSRETRPWETIRKICLYD